MSTEAIYITILSSILSGILAVVISTIYYQKFEKRKLKIDVLRRIVGGRFYLTAKEINPTNNDFFTAINEAFIVFNKDKKVLEALEKMHNELSIQGRLLDNIVSLVKVMCKATRMNYTSLNDSFIERPFVPGNK